MRSDINAARNRSVAKLTSRLLSRRPCIVDFRRHLSNEGGCARDFAVADVPFVTTLVDYPSFRLSRAYAQGWNAARRLPADAERKTMAELNPHKSEPERARWTEGFLQALA